MSHSHQNPSSPIQALRQILRNDACPRCEHLLVELNDAFRAVHGFILRNYEDRNQNDAYLGELGRLIHAQVVARRDLIRHQNTH